jgi:alpha-amylase/alpha-mannosidase (GH57 family)
MIRKYICIHGHFYQPPRENPWLEKIEIQESAHPFHDWNERIAYECYKPNTQARILDQYGRLRDVLNNYEHISFDFGPTLLSWLDRHDPETYQALLDADAVSVKRRSGHGNALAQAYNHMIMPLASSRDRLTQIIWGIEDFRRRYQRDPEGMWLPETAVDLQSLRIMATHGIKFTILSQNQARRFKLSPKQEWETFHNGAIDPSRPYLCRLSKKLSIAIFFYDGPISRAIAFEKLLDNGEELKDRLLNAFSTDDRPQLINIATDGESYGHHHRFGEMALSYALKQLFRRHDVRVTNYGEYLALHPPKAEVEIIEDSSWSCAHGVGRWSGDCGCSISQKPEWNQKWRAPLREALDLLRDRADSLFEEQGRGIFKDPWEARNDYIQVLLENRPKIGPFFKKHGLKQLRKEDRIKGLQLLELQRNRMLMYTSCGWFFDDVSGIESLQVLRYAARAIQIVYPFDPDVLEDFLSVLKNAKSNLRPHPTGDEIFREKIITQVSGLPRVAAHAAILSVFDGVPPRKRLYCYEIALHDFTKEQSGDRTLLVAAMTVLSRITTESMKLAVAAHYFGGVDVRCSVTDYISEYRYTTAKEELLEAFRSQSVTELGRKMDRHFSEAYYSVKDLFVEERRKVLNAVTGTMYEAEAGLFETHYRKNRDLAKLFVEQDAYLPDTFVAVARFSLNRRLIKEVDKLSNGKFPEGLEAILQEAGFWKINLDLDELERLIRTRIVQLTGQLQASEGNVAVAAEIIMFLDLCERLECRIELGEAQIGVFRILKTLGHRTRELPHTLVELAQRLAVRL